MEDVEGLGKVLILEYVDGRTLVSIPKSGKPYISPIAPVRKIMTAEE